IPVRDLSAGLFQPSPDAPEAVLDLAPDARWITEYYATETVRDMPDGTVRVRIRAGDQQWLRRFVLRQAGDVRVVEPAELAAQVLANAREALAAYELS